MAERKRVILHIGMAKTGTTSLQYYLWSNRKELSNNGIGYYSEQFRPWTAYSNAGFLCGQSLNAARGWEWQNPDYLSEMEAFTEFAKDYNTLILSEEFMWEKGIEEASFWRELKNIIYLTVGEDTVIDIVVFLRRQDEWILSRWKENLIDWYKNDERDFPEYLSDMEKLGFLDYEIALRRIADCFGRGHMEVCAYGAREHEGYDTVREFLSATDINYSGLEASKKPRMNPSLSMRAAKAMLLINRQQHDDISRDKLAYVARIFSMMHPDNQNYYPISADDRRKILSRIEEKNDRLFLEYGNGISCLKNEFDDYQVWEDNREQEKKDAHSILKLATLSNKTLKLLRGEILYQ